MANKKKSMQAVSVKVPEARQLASGAWFIQLRLNGESIPITRETPEECTAEAVRVKSAFKAMPQEEKRELKKERAAKRQEAKAPKAKTLSEAIDDYIEAGSATLSPVSIRSYRIIQMNRLQSLMNCPVDTITADMVQKAVNEDLQKFSSKTMKSSVGFISSVIKKSTGKALDRVSVGQVIVKEKTILQPEQIKQFTESAQGHRFELPALLALHGLRVSEIMNLTWESIKDGYIIVHGAAVPDENNILIHKATNKNETSRRSVPIMMDRLQVVYDELRAKALEDGEINTNSADEMAAFNHSYIFHYNSESTINGGIERICKRAKVERVSTHGLRHSFCSLCYHLNISEELCMKLGGWSDIMTMRKIYTHIAKVDEMSGIQALRSAFNS